MERLRWLINILKKIKVDERQKLRTRSRYLKLRKFKFKDLRYFSVFY